MKGTKQATSGTLRSSKELVVVPAPPEEHAAIESIAAAATKTIAFFMMRPFLRPATCGFAFLVTPVYGRVKIRLRNGAALE